MILANSCQKKYHSYQKFLGILLLVLIGLVLFYPSPAHASYTTLSEHIDSMKNTWKYILSLIDYLVVVFLIFIAFANILHIQVDTYTVKKTLPSLILAVVLANLSFFICKMFVDFATVFIQGQEALVGHFAPPSASPPGGGNWSLLLIFYWTYFDKAMQDPSLFAGYLLLTGGAVAAALPTLGLSILLGMILNFVVFGLPAILFMIVLFLLFIRVLVVDLLVITSPMAFIFLGFPLTQKYFSWWWSQFMKWVFLAPAAYILWTLAIIIIKSITSQQSAFTGFAKFALTIGALYFSIKVPFWLGGNVMAAWAKPAQKAAALGAAGVKSAGKTGWNLGSNWWDKNVLPKTGIPSLRSMVASGKEMLTQSTQESTALGSAKTRQYVEGAQKVLTGGWDASKGRISLEEVAKMGGTQHYANAMMGQIREKADKNPRTEADAKAFLDQATNQGNFQEASIAALQLSKYRGLNTKEQKDFYDKFKDQNPDVIDGVMDMASRNSRSAEHGLPIASRVSKYQDPATGKTKTKFLEDDDKDTVLQNRQNDIMQRHWNSATISGREASIKNAVRELEEYTQSNPDGLGSDGMCKSAYHDGIRSFLTGIHTTKAGKELIEKYVEGRIDQLERGGMNFGTVAAISPSMLLADIRNLAFKSGNATVKPYEGLDHKNLDLLDKIDLGSRDPEEIKNKGKFAFNLLGRRAGIESEFLATKDALPKGLKDILEEQLKDSSGVIKLEKLANINVETDIKPRIHFSEHGHLGMVEKLKDLRGKMDAIDTNYGGSFDEMKRKIRDEINRASSSLV